MKLVKSLFIVLFVFVGLTVFGQQSEVLSNESVINMHNKGLPASIIMSRIKTTRNTFDISTDALIKLTDNKISEDLLNAIVDAAGDAARHFVVIDPNNPKDMHDSGVYYVKKTGGKSELVPLETTIYSQAKSGGALMSSLTYGISKVKTSVTLDGNSSRMQLAEKNPEFYFYFDLAKKSLSESSDWWFSAATSPNEFILVDLTIKKKDREVVTGAANIGGTTVGVADKNKMAFKFDKIAPGIYKVYFEKPLEGEFCFMYAGQIPTGFTAINKVYDFGVNVR